MAISDVDFPALNLANRGSALDYAPNDPLLLPRQVMLAKNPAIREVTCRLAIASLQRVVSDTTTAENCSFHRRELEAFDGLGGKYNNSVHLHRISNISPSADSFARKYKLTGKTICRQRLRAMRRLYENLGFTNTIGIERCKLILRTCSLGPQQSQSPNSFRPVR